MEKMEKILYIFIGYVLALASVGLILLSDKVCQEILNYLYGI